MLLVIYIRTPEPSAGFASLSLALPFSSAVSREREKGVKETGGIVSCRRFREDFSGSEPWLMKLTIPTVVQKFVDQFRLSSTFSQDMQTAGYSFNMPLVHQRHFTAANYINGAPQTRVMPGCRASYDLSMV
ncbi:unnamed protein product [Musa acuminata subsp. burmannicoides]